MTLKVRKGRGSRGKLIRHDDEYLEQMEEYINEKEAASILGLSVGSVRAYKSDGRLPSEVAPNGVNMLLRQGVLDYKENRFIKEKLPFAKCEECGNNFTRTKLTSGRAKDESQKFYRDGNLCPDCRRAKKDGEVVEEYTTTYEPHSGGQWDVHNSTARFRILCAGARWGKDRCSVNEFIQKFAQMLSEDRDENKIPRVHGALIAPNFRLTRQIWREIKQFIPSKMVERVYEGEKYIETRGGGLIEVVSADDANSLVGVGYDIVLFTEFARASDQEGIWTQMMARTNSPGCGPEGKGGLILANSTPTGKNFWHTLVRMGTKGDDLYDPNYESFVHPTTDNPYVNKEEIEKLRKVLPDRLYRQEFEAAFLEEADSVFRYVKELANYTGPEEPEAGEQYVIGWDPAMVSDFSAVAVRNSAGQVVTLRRWTGVPWEEQMNRIVLLSHYYNYAPVVVDITGLGRSLPQTLEKRGIVVGEDNMVLFNSTVKEQLVNNLALLMEQKAIAYPADHEFTPALITELSNFKYYINEKTGTIRYSAPRGNGQNDDLVTAVMLCFKDFTDAAFEMPFFGFYGGVTIGGKRGSMAN